MLSKKNKDIISDFRRILKKNPFYKTSAIYEIVSNNYYITPSRIQAIVNNYYRDNVTKEMVSYFKSISNMKTTEYLNLFALKFDIKEQEARIIITYIKRSNGSTQKTVSE